MVSRPSRAATCAAPSASAAPPTTMAGVGAIRNEIGVASPNHPSIEYGVRQIERLGRARARRRRPAVRDRPASRWPARWDRSAASACARSVRPGARSRDAAPLPSATTRARARDLGEVQRLRLEAAAVRRVEILERFDRAAGDRRSDRHAHVRGREATAIAVDDDRGQQPDAPPRPPGRR